MMDRAVAPRTVGRYLLFDEIAAGGMASVHFGRMMGAAGFARTVAIKRLHTQFAKDPEFVSMFIDEARLAARIAHPNVVSTIDIVNDGGEMLLVMEYVFGASLSHLWHRAQLKGQGIPAPVAVSIMTGALYGLHAAHEAKSDSGERLGVVHRDISPQNILVGADGVARVVDFGIAKAVGRLQTTRDGQLKGKAAYMAPEQIRGLPVDQRTDIYSASVVLWEALVGQRLFTADHPLGVMNAVFEKVIPPVSEAQPGSGVSPALDAIVAKGMARSPDERFATAREMAMALEGALHPATTREVGDWVRAEAVESLARRARRVTEIESSSEVGLAPLPASDVAIEEAGGGTSASHVSDASAPRPARRGAGLIVGACAAVLLVAGILLLRPSSASHPPPTAAPSPPDPITVPPKPSASTPSVASAIPSAVTSAGPGPSGSVSPPRTSAPRNPGRGPRPQTSPRGSGPSCNPPYTVDTDGTRHWKDGC